MEGMDDSAKFFFDLLHTGGRHPVSFFFLNQFTVVIPILGDKLSIWPSDDERGAILAVVLAIPIIHLQARTIGIAGHERGAILAVYKPAGSDT